VAPLGDRDPAVGDVVLVRCVVAATTSTLVRARQSKKILDRQQTGGINGWVGRPAIVGVAIGIGRRLREPCKPRQSY
jgi:hypothetical protein